MAQFHIPLLPGVSSITDAETKKWATALSKALDSAFVKLVTMPMNRSEVLAVADTGNADTEFNVSHGLRKIPRGFICVNTDKAAILYDSGTAWTTTKIYLKCNAANAAVSILVF